MNFNVLNFEQRESRTWNNSTHSTYGWTVSYSPVASDLLSDKYCVPKLHSPIKRTLQLLFFVSVVLSCVKKKCNVLTSIISALNVRLKWKLGEKQWNKFVRNFAQVWQQQCRNSLKLRTKFHPRKCEELKSGHLSEPKPLLDIIQKCSLFRHL